MEGNLENLETYFRFKVFHHVYSLSRGVEVLRILANPCDVTQFSLGGPSYLRLWNFSPNEGLSENPSLFPLKQEKLMKAKKCDREICRR